MTEESDGADRHTTKHEAWLEARSRISAFLELNSKWLGPRSCAHGIFGDGECSCTYDETEAVDDLVINGWYLAVNYTRMSDGESYTGFIAPPTQLRSQSIGLLYMGLKSEGG